MRRSTSRARRRSPEAPSNSFAIDGRPRGRPFFVSMPHGCQQLFERACRATQFQEMLMLVVGTQVIADRGGKDGFTVEFVGEGGEVVSVEMRNDNGRTLNRMNA